MLYREVKYREVKYREVIYREVIYREVKYREVKYREVKYREVEALSLGLDSNEPVNIKFHTFLSMPSEGINAAMEKKTFPKVELVDSISP